jgi:hypothetical protein
MVKYFIGNYSDECRFFQNNNLRLGNGYLMRTIQEMGVSGMHFHRRLMPPYGKRTKRYRYIETSPVASPRGGKGFFSSIDEGTVRIPEEAVKYANLLKGKVSVIGMINHLEIWNTDKIEEALKHPLTDEDLEKIAGSFAGK